MPRLVWILVPLLAASGCLGGNSYEGGVGSFNEGCGFEGTHSVLVAEHSCACEPGYTWCSDALADFECCPSEDPDTADTGAQSPAPEEICDAETLEQLRCIPDPDNPYPSAAVVWACNGERWTEVPGYSDFACAALGLPFAYGCVPGPDFVCGFGPGTVCDPAGTGGICVDEDIIDTCVWGLRTVDRCSRLCGVLEAYGPGYSTGYCQVSVNKQQPAVCVCSP